MTTANSGAGGVNSQAGGDAGENNETKNSVAYETHQKLLGEKKKRESELEETRKQLAELKDAEKQRTEAELKAKEDYKKLLENRDKELGEVKSKLTETETAIAEGRKLSAFLDSLNGVVEKQYWGLIPTDKVILDPATGQPDPASLQTAVREFEKSYALVVKPKEGSKGLPSGAAQGGGGKLTVAQYNALPTSKDMKSKFHLVDWNT